jgi:hypothetical protein
VLAVAEDLVKQLGDASSCLRRGMWTRHAQAYCYICVLMLLYMCPHGMWTRHAQAYCYICVLMLLYILLYMCPHATIYTAIYVSSCYYICVLMLLYMRPHASAAACVRAMHRHTAIYVC